MSLYGQSQEQEIASDQLDGLKEHPDRTAQVSRHVGSHPYLRWNDDLGAFEIAETSGIGNVEVTACPKGDLLNLLAENPVDVKPISKATYSPPEPGTARIWESVDAEEGHVTHTNRADYVGKSDENVNGGDR
jgi:hypothetical protein